MKKLKRKETERHSKLNTNIKKKYTDLETFFLFSLSFPRDLEKSPFKWGYTGYKYKGILYFLLLALLVLNKPFGRGKLF
jgi:hypothetical protein